MLSMRTKLAILIGLLMAVSVAAGQQPAPPAVPSCPELGTALSALVRNARDWANLTRYREMNRTVAAPAANDARVVFMGDSITDAWPQPLYGDFFTGKPYVGRGISG